MGLLTQRRCDGQKATSNSESVLSRNTVPPGQSMPGLVHHRKDWRPTLDKKMQDLLYGFGASLDLKSNSNVMKMGEAYHERATDCQDEQNTAQIGEGYYMKAMFPGADFDGSLIEEARKQRMETLENSIRGGEKLDSVSQENNNSTLKVKDPGDKYLDELLLLRNHIAPRRGRNQQAIKMVKSDEQAVPAAQPFTSDDMILDTPMADCPKPNGPSPDGPTPSELHEEVWSALRIGSPWADSVSGHGAGGSDTPTVGCATNAAVWRSGSKYDGSPEEQGQEEEDRAGGVSTNALGKLIDLEKWVDAHVPESPESLRRRDSGFAGSEEKKTGLEETKSRFANGDGYEEARLPGPSPKTSPSSLLNSLPLSGGRREKTAPRHLEHGKPRLKSMMKEAPRCSRRLTTAEKGKSRAKCEVAQCRPQRSKSVRFDCSAMDTTEDGPALSFDEFVTRMSENRRRMEADPRGEGCSSWARAGPTKVVGMDMFTNPRPAPPVPVPVPVSVPVHGRGQETFTVFKSQSARGFVVDKRDIGIPMEQKRNVNPRGRCSPGPRTGNAGETAPTALQRKDRRGRQRALLAWSRRFRR